jgi:uncharacterized protein YndB with AHSA1/START domain
MWAHEVDAETSATREAIWRLWSDVEGWPRWNSDIESIAIDGPFADGSRITMKPFGEEPIGLRLAEVVEDHRFVDEAQFGELLIRTTHRVDPAGDDRLRVIYRMEITGEGADQAGPEIGPQITADFPETIAALIKRAEL